MTPPEPPPRRRREVAFVALGILFSVLALALPMLRVGTAGVPISVAPFLFPVRQPADAIALLLAFVLFAALIAPHVVLVRAVSRRRAGGIGRIVALAAGAVTLLTGLVLSAYASSPAGRFAIPAVLSLTLAGVTVLVAQRAILGRLAPVSRRWQ